MYVQIYISVVYYIMQCAKVASTRIAIGALDYTCSLQGRNYRYHTTVISSLPRTAEGRNAVNVTKKNKNNNNFNNVRSAL